MDVISIILLAIGLSLDDFALGLALGLAYTPPTKKERIYYGIKMAIAFSVSSAILPLLGWAIGLLIYNWVVTFSAWLLLIVFCGVGIWIIKEAFEEEHDKDNLKMKNLSSIWVLMGLGVLGSIDEGAVGIGYAFIDVSIPLLILLVVLFNTLLVFVALSICTRVTKSKQKYPPIIAGLILIALGLKNWIELLWIG